MAKVGKFLVCPHTLLELSPLSDAVEVMK